MRRVWALSLIMLLTACGRGEPPKPVTRVTASVVGDHSAVYWLDSQQGRPISLSEHVWQGDYGEYRGEYVWRDGQLRALKREGEQLADNTRVPFSLHVRFDASGEPVFQRYRQDGAIIPLDSAALTRLYQESNQILDQVQSQIARNVSVLQGQRIGEYWVDCRGDRQRWVFDDAIPPVVVSKLLQPGTFVIGAGNPGIGKDTIDALVLVRREKACLTRPQLLAE